MNLRFALALEPRTRRYGIRVAMVQGCVRREVTIAINAGAGAGDQILSLAAGILLAATCPTADPVSVFAIAIRAWRNEF